MIQERPVESPMERTPLCIRLRLLHLEGQPKHSERICLPAACDPA